MTTGSSATKAAVKVTFSYTGADQAWTVPVGVSSITIKAWGAGGGWPNGGGGGYVSDTISVSKSEVIAVVVGGTKREFVLPVPREMKSAIEANAWSYGLSAKDMQIEVRT